MKATEAGRDLVLDPEGGVRPFTVHPVSARRGRLLTERFVEGTLGKLSVPAMESIFIDAFGPANYSRATGYIVEKWAFSRTDQTDEGEKIATYVGDEVTVHGPEIGTREPVYATRDPLPSEEWLEGEALTQHDVEVLCLSAFYWHTVVGFEAVEAFLKDGGTTAAQGKVTGLLVLRGVLSPSPNLSPTVTALSTQTADSSGTSDTRNSSGSVPLPARPAPTDRKAPTGKRRRGRRPSQSSGSN